MTDQQTPPIGRRGFMVGAGLAAGAATGVLGTQQAAVAHRATTTPRVPKPPISTIIYGNILHFLTNPLDNKTNNGYWEHFKKGALVVDQHGKVAWVGRQDDLPTELAQAAEEIREYDRERYLITPGLIDSHVHSVQIDAIAFGGLQLLPWLQNTVFPAEKRFRDPSHAKRYAEFFTHLLLSNGITSASVHTTAYKQAAMALHQRCADLNMRMNIGIVGMDSDFNFGLTQSVAETKAAIEEQIATWDGKQRQTAVITPRFALSCTPTMMQMLGEFSAGGTRHTQTHCCENIKEITDTQDIWTAALGRPVSYFEVYEHFGMMGPKSNFHHCNHLSKKDFEMLAKYQCSVSHCPDSNGHLGSGWADLHSLELDWGINVGLGTDCGAGTNYSLVQTMHDCYKTVILRENAWDWAELYEPPPPPALPPMPGPTPRVLQPQPTDALRGLVEGIGWKPVSAQQRADVPHDPATRGRMDLTAWQAFWLGTMGSARALAHEDKIGNFETGKEADFVVWDYWATPVLRQRSKIENLNDHDWLFGLMMMGGANYPVRATYLQGVKRYDSENPEIVL